MWLETPQDPDSTLDCVLGKIIIHNHVWQRIKSLVVYYRVVIMSSRCKHIKTWPDPSGLSVKGETETAVINEFVHA